MKEYRLRKFVAEENKVEPRMIFSRFYKTSELAMVAAQEDSNAAALTWNKISETVLESRLDTLAYDIKTFEFEGA